MMAYGRERERVATLTFYAVVVLLAYLVFRLFQPFLAPLGWATVLVVCWYPWHARYERRWGRTPAAALSTAAVTVMLIVPGLLVMTAFIQEGAQAAANIERALAAGQLPRVERVWIWVQQRVLGQAPSDLGALAKDGATRVATFLASQAGAVLRNVALFFFNLVVTLFIAFFLFRDAGTIMRGIRRVLPFDEAQRERIIAQTRDLIFASVTAGLIVAAVQGTLGGLMFALLGIRAPVFWGVVMAFFSLLPFVGAWVVWGPVAIWLMVSGEMTRALILIGLGAGIVGTADNFLRPALLSGRAQLNGLLVFISLLGGMQVFGILGLVLGPIVLATAASLLDAYTRPE